MIEECIAAIRHSHPDLAIDQSPESRTVYSKDESFSSGLAQAVFFPTAPDQVSGILKASSRWKVPVIPRGAGSGLSGACVPTRPSLIVSLERMNRILDIDLKNHVAVVEPGVITGRLREEVEKVGLYYPPVPSSLDFCTLGGNVATNAGGLCAVKYGVTRKYVLGLEAVLPSGEILHTGGKFVKHTSGYELTQLITGSEGTLAVITKIYLALLPLPTERTTILVPFPSIHESANCVQSLLSQGHAPATLELMPQGAVACVLGVHPELSFPWPHAPSTLLIELDGFSKEQTLRDHEAMYNILSRHMSDEPLIASSSGQREAFWSVRKKIRECIARADAFVEADAVVPRQHLPELIRAAEGTASEFGIKAVSYGHAGDGNLHTYFQKSGLPSDRWSALQNDVLSSFFHKVIGLDGTISGEHGIGHLKKSYLPMAHSEVEIALMKKLKAAFDPENLLNPHKIFP